MGIDVENSVYKIVFFLKLGWKVIMVNFFGKNFFFQVMVFICMVEIIY